VKEKNEGPTTTKGKRRKWIGGRGGKGRGRDLPDQCQTASYAPEICRRPDDEEFTKETSNVCVIL